MNEAITTTTTSAVNSTSTTPTYTFSGTLGTYNTDTICRLFGMSIGTDTDKRIKEKNGSLYIGAVKLMPSVKEINPIYNKDNEMIGIKMMFSDGSIEKSICDNEDIFNYDYGVVICLMKKILSNIASTDKYTGTYYFNKIVDLAFRGNLKTFEEKAKEETEKIKAEYRKAKNRLRKERQKAAKREAEIEIQKEAYLRAMNEFEGRK